MFCESICCCLLSRRRRRQHIQIAITTDVKTMPAPTPALAPIAVVFIPPSALSSAVSSTGARDGDGVVVGIVEDAELLLEEVVAGISETDALVFVVSLDIVRELVATASTVTLLELGAVLSLLIQNWPV